MKKVFISLNGLSICVDTLERKENILSLILNGKMVGSIDSNLYKLKYAGESNNSKFYDLVLNLRLK